MDLQQAQSEIAAIWQDGQIPMLWGLPGIGKSASVYAIAGEAQIFEVRLALVNPLELTGYDLPSPEGGTVYCPPVLLPEQSAIQSIIFWDELLQAPPAIQALASQPLYTQPGQPLRIGRYVGPKNVRQIVASNRESDRAIVYRMPSHLQSRLVHLDIECTWQGCRDYANRHWHSTICALLEWMPELLHTWNPSASGHTYACPRSWEMLSQSLKHGLPSHDRIIGTIGDVAGNAYANLLELLPNLPKISEIINNPMETKVPATIGEQCLIGHNAYRELSVSTADAIWTYISRLPAELTRVFIEMGKRDGLRHLMDCAGVRLCAEKCHKEGVLL